MMAFSLEVWLDGFRHQFDFTAEDDDEARRLVAAFGRVAQRCSYGPLWRTGQVDTRDGVTAIYKARKAIPVPLDVQKIAPGARLTPR